MPRESAYKNSGCFFYYWQSAHPILLLRMVSTIKFFDTVNGHGYWEDLFLVIQLRINAVNAY